MRTMSWLARAAARWKYPEQRVWFAVAVWAAVLVVLIVASAAGYSAIVYARTVVTLSAEHSVTWSGTTAAGVLLASGTVTDWIVLTVSNPSDRAFALTSVAYRSWIEDLPAEAGLVSRADSILMNATGTHRFYSAFLGSFGVTDVVVPAHASRSVTYSFNLTAADGEPFLAVQNITEYASHVLGNGTAVPWVHWIEIALVLQGVPTPSPSAGEYLPGVVRIVLQEGLNLG